VPETSHIGPGPAAPRRVRKLPRMLDPIFLMLVGIVGIADGTRIINIKREVVGGIATGGWIAGLGALLVAGTIIHLAKGAGPAEETDPDGSQVLLKQPVIAFAMLVIYIALIEPLGYMLSTVLFMAIYLRVFGHYRYVTIAAISCLFAVASGWLWAVMNMMLPQGLLPWP
jgi:putative tricarboxylic transport membrane protein